MCIYIYINAYMYTYTNSFLSMRVYTCTHFVKFVSLSLSPYIYICMYVHIVYIHIYICIYICICVYSYLYVNVVVSRWLKTNPRCRTHTERALKIHALGHAADMSAVWHSTHVRCVAQQTCLLCDTEVLSAVWHSSHVCCVPQHTCLLCVTGSLTSSESKVRSVLLAPWIPSFLFT